MYRIIGSDQKEYGPVSADVVRQWIREGRVNSATSIKPESQEGWVPISSLPEFAGDFAAAPPATVPVASPSAPLEPRKTNGFATAGLIVGAIALPCCQPLGVVGLILSVIALVQINASPQTQEGKGLAIGGLICSLLALLWFVVGALFIAGQHFHFRHF